MIPALRTSTLAKLTVSSRPVSWINTAFPFAAAYYLSRGHLDATLIVGTLFFLVPYNLAMYGINDVFDYESDLANPRKGGLEGALLDRGLHRVTLVVAIGLCVPFVVVLVLAGTWVSAVVLAISLFAVAAYSIPGLRFKEKPFLDSVTSSVHFVSPAVFGLALAAVVVTPALVAVLVSFFLWGVASHAFGAVQDVMPDREGGIRSIATVMGAAWTVRFAIAAWLLAGLLMLATPWPAPLAGLLALPYIVVALPFRAVADGRSASANRGWKRFIWLNYLCGFLVTLLLIVYSLERPLR
ncbi:prenyltransferase [Leifsonia sp. Root112D2]|jgi:4-hydroxybenzoate polyprenyltransferase|uniref:prenyltransferase n=1 Tax=Leifsonia sp. Root112D2 TaxID=1736426 RepID=UPI0006F7A0B1|nr:prenyltransferase [Leifsonia sp. Root112D2]KQV06601.1 prenyltransferase [Leifsonia sp. Root112D2]